MTVFTAGILMMSISYGQIPRQSEEPPGIQKTKNASVGKFIGFVDKNNDGINDLFLDADGAGKNDLDGKKYPHKFEFQDLNKDKINDIWIDRDGDGVNDLGSRFTEMERQERHRNVLDVDEDGQNDITGDKYDPANYHWRGESRGFWDENNGKLQGAFIDADGDGIDDRLKDFDNFIKSRHGGEKRLDMFIDMDGDGICDDRTDFLNSMGKHGRKGKSNSGNDKHGGHH